MSRRSTPTHLCSTLPLLAGACLLLASACYQYRLTPVGPDRQPLRAATEPQEVTLWSFGWGLAAQPLVQPDCQGNGTAEVTASTNLGYTLLTVVTLGIVVPVQLEWRCAKDAAGNGGDDF